MLESYTWEQIEGPSVPLSNTNTITAGFTAPAVYQQTTYGFRLTVVDDEGGSTSDEIRITVISVNPDDDGDGMDDLWEITNFGTLDRNGSGDADGDGATDLMEFEFGTDPNVPQGPSEPSIVSPDDIEVTQFQPQLVITNADHHLSFEVNYQFEVYSDPEMTQLVTRVDAVAEGTDGTTSWTVDTPLSENTSYYWRVRPMVGSCSVSG